MTSVNKKVFKTFSVLSEKSFEKLSNPNWMASTLPQSTKEAMLSGEWFAKEGPGNIKWDIWCDRYTHIATCELKELAQHIVSLHNAMLRKVQ